MADVQARALYDFESGGPGELSFYTNEVLTILRQDVGAGWWEATNSRGVRGLVPESYLEITSFPEPSIPPPPPPTKTVQPARNSTWNPPPVGRPSALPTVKQNSNQQLQNRGQENCDEWDDDWDDDDSSTTTETPEMPAGSVYSTIDEQSLDNRGVVRRTTEKSTRGHTGSVRIPFNRFSTFTKMGGDTYLFETSTHVPESAKTFVIVDSADGPKWRPLDNPYVCSIKSPKKETKFHGMKTFIVYQITPTFSNIQVSRRYKHFDWLQQRLAEKFSGIAVPPLPEKQIAGRFEDDFVSQRLRQLQLWMDRMCNHPVVSNSDVFKHFLTCTDDKKWKVGKRKAEKEEFLGGKFFLTVKIPNHPLDSKQAEQRIEKFTKFVRNVDESVKHLCTVGENNAKKHEGPFKKEFQKIGGSFVALAKSFEFDERPAAQNLTQAIEYTGRTYDDIGELFAKQPPNDMYLLLEGLHEYRGLLSTFPESLATHKTAMTKIQENSTKLPESDLQSAQSRADVITYTILAEIEHFNQFRVGDFKSYLQKYLRGQIDFFRQVSAKLEDALHQYDRA